MRVFVGLFFCVSVSLTAWGQTNPTPQSLPYSQDFSSLASTSTSYPDGWQGWQLSASGSSSSFRTVAPLGDQPLKASCSASTTTGGVNNYNGKIGVLASTSYDPSLCLAINTTGFVDVSVEYEIMTIRNPYDGSSNTRINESTLQYRVGASGSFTSLTGVEYQNNTTTQTGTGVTTPQNPQTKAITLPSSCSNQSIVQLRWVQRDVSGGGSRPGFAVDNVAVSGTSDVSLPVTTRCSSARVEDGRVILTFSTASEINVVGFNILRANAAAGPFELISSFYSNPVLKASGSPVTGGSYSFIDPKVSAGRTYYYKIEAVDMTGESDQAGGVLEVLVGTPKSFSVHQNYPNPFNPATTVRYQLPSVSHVTLKVYDILGRVVATLVDMEQKAGTHEASFDGTKHSGGTYFYRLTAEQADGTTYRELRKMILVK